VLYKRLVKSWRSTLFGLFVLFCAWSMWQADRTMTTRIEGQIALGVVISGGLWLVGRDDRQGPASFPQPQDRPKR
jgi:hypothetical protein